MSNNNTNTKKTTFWKFLTDNTIEIPIIQRDYAQGREGKEHLRKNFLSDLKVALDKGEELKLDFVYGSKENNKLNPLDGQQRLTTLWLLHWYIAFRSGRLTDANTTLNKFTYETRISSREFCKELCKTENFKKYCFGNIVEYIKNQTWFYSAWKQDPTIQSMLRMLGGTTNKAGEPNNDGIEQVFNCSGCEITNNEKQCKYEKYWNLLAESDESPIIFYYLPLNEFKLTDDLYIKMNARGEQLTSFENFKADLIGYITKQKDNDELPKEAKEEWGKLLDEKEGIPIKLDTTWTEFFWKNKSQDYKIDEIYFAFFNRFFFNELVCAKDIEKNGYLFAADGIEDNASFNLLYGEKSDDSSIKYEDFEKYRFYNKEIPIELFVSIKDVLDSLDRGIFNNAVINYCFPKWVDKKFLFFPTYQNSTITTLGQKERVVFLAVCRYFENGGYETSFVQWMRVVWNIVENARVETVPSMIGAMRLVDELSKHSHGIYAFLSNTKSQINSDFAKDQVKEEIAKAKQILDEDGSPRKYNGSCKKEDGSEYQTWEDIISDAESHAFFKGAIRFLFQNENGGVDIDTESGTWNTKNFDTKLENARTYFDDNGVKDKKNSLLLRTLISYFTEWKDLEEIYYNNEPSEWRNWILLNKNLCKYTNCLLIDQQNVVAERFANFDSKIKDDRKKRIHEKLVKSNILDYVINRSPNGFILSYDSFLKIESGYKSRSDDFVFRIDFLDLSPLCNENTIKTNKKIQYYDLFNGWNVDFEYKNNIFRWFWNPNDTKLDIYLMKFVEDKKEYRKRIGHINDNVTDEDTYFCFKITKEMASGDILAQLDCLIQQACAEEAGKDCFKDCPNKKGNHLS